MRYLFTLDFTDPEDDIKLKRQFEVTGPTSLDDFWTFDCDGELQMEAEDIFAITLDGGGSSTPDGQIVEYGYGSGEIESLEHGEKVIEHFVQKITEFGWSLKPVPANEIVNLYSDRFDEDEHEPE